MVVLKMPSSHLTSRPPSRIIGTSERSRCWLVPMRPVTPFMMTPSFLTSVPGPAAAARGETSAAPPRRRLPSTCRSRSFELLLRSIIVEGPDESGMVGAGDMSSQIWVSARSMLPVLFIVLITGRCSSCEDLIRFATSMVSGASSRGPGKWREA